MDSNELHLATDLTQNAIPEAGRFVLLPAAGISSRMGQHKLSLPFGNQSLIATVVQQYLDAQVDTVMVVRRPDDEQLLTALPKSPRLSVVTPPESPVDMKASIRFGIAAVEQIRPISKADLFLLSPPDMPFLSPELVLELIEQWKTISTDVLIPTFQGQRAHPVLFSGQVAKGLEAIPDDQGVNWLWKSGQFRIEEFPVSEEGVLIDVDTPAAYKAALAKLRSEGG